MITFESVGDYPNGYSISDAELTALYAIMTSDPDSYDYDVTEVQETSGFRFMVVEKRCPKYEYASTYYRVDTDGSWGVLYEVPQLRNAETSELVRRHVNLRIKISHQGAQQAFLDEDRQIVAELVRRGVLDT